MVGFFSVAEQLEHSLTLKIRFHYPSKDTEFWSFIFHMTI